MTVKIPPVALASTKSPLAAVYVPLLVTTLKPAVLGLELASMPPDSTQFVPSDMYVPVVPAANELLPIIVPEGVDTVTVPLPVLIRHNWPPFTGDGRVAANVAVHKYVKPLSTLVLLEIDIGTLLLRLVGRFQVPVVETFVNHLGSTLLLAILAVPASAEPGDAELFR